MGYKWQDPHFKVEVEGIKVLIDGVKNILTKDFCHSPSFILKMIPESYDLELLQNIQRIVGEKEIEYDPDDCYGFGSEGEITLKSKLIEITTKHARTIAILKTQPSILNLVEEIDELKKQLKTSEDVILRAKQDLLIANNKISKLEQSLKCIPELESQKEILIRERETFKETVLQKVRDALS